MTDSKGPAPKPFDMAAAMARYQADRDDYETRASAIRPANKTALFDALAASGITQVTVSFDGYGDSGQIEDISAIGAGGHMALPETEISIATTSWGNAEITEHRMAVREAVEQLVYDCLAQTHPGWENNDGAYGEFTFDVAARVIALEHNERFTATETYAHEF